jgi:ketosteroid isomerase-like protein
VQGAGDEMRAARNVIRGTKRMTTEDDVRAVSDRFYDALQQMVNGDTDPMSEVWSHRDDVTTMHPIGGREVGWDEVRESWESVADISEGGEVERTDQFIHVEGESAYELVTEHVSWSLAGQEINEDARGTNIYHFEDGEWKIIHHHTDTGEEAIEALQSLEADE